MLRKCSKPLKTLFQKIPELTSLIFTQMKVACIDTLEWIRSVYRYYGNVKFRNADRLILLDSFAHNPYRISRTFLKQKGESDLYVYGETPLTSMDEIIKRCCIRPDDTFVELGAGRGRAALWVATHIGCPTIAIEHVPHFTYTARKAANKAGITNIGFRNEDFFESDLTDGSVFFLYGTNLPDDQINQLANKLSQLPSGTRFITVSYPLPSSDFELIRRFPISFNWGQADVYLQARR